MDNKLLKLSQEEMRKLGYSAIDLLVSHFENIQDRPIGNTPTRKTAEDLINEPLPSIGSHPEEILDKLNKDVFSNVMHLDHPRFFGWVSSPSNYISVIGDMLASGFNTFSGLWMLSGGPAQIELTTLNWLKEIIGMPKSAGGLFVSGGSVANLTALTVARNIRLKDNIGQAIIYCSDQTHFSNLRALKILGFKDDQIRKIPSNKNYQINLSILKREIQRDKKAGKTPFCVIANAGTTNTGSVDPLLKLNLICKNENLWLHVDGAFGASAVLNKKVKKQLNGIELADSVSIDPHKWLFQPYEIGCVLVKNEGWLKDTFYSLPEYLKDAEGLEEEVNFSHRGIQLTRGFRALKLWMSIKVFGIDAFRKAVTHGIKLAEFTEREVRKMENWELITKAQLGILTFRYLPRTTYFQADTINKKIAEQLIRDKFALVSTSTLAKRVVIRMCIINPRTTKSDIQLTLQKLNTIARRIDGICPLTEEKLDEIFKITTNKLDSINRKLEQVKEVSEEQV